MPNPTFKWLKAYDDDNDSDSWFLNVLELPAQTWRVAGKVTRDNRAYWFDADEMLHYLGTYSDRQEAMNAIEEAETAGKQELTEAARWVRKQYSGGE